MVPPEVCLVSSKIPSSAGALAKRSAAMLALPVMRHRMGLNFAAQSDGVNTDDVVSQLLDSIPTGGELYDGTAKAAG